jgi:excisionase family DNA binding protein
MSEAQTQTQVPVQAPIKLLLTMEEAAQALGLSLRLFYTLVLTKQVESIKIGRCRRVPVKALQDYVERQMQLN